MPITIIPPSDKIDRKEFKKTLQEKIKEIQSNPLKKECDDFVIVGIELAYSLLK